MGECKEVGLALRRERERRGITLEAVAETTKIGPALLAGLERGDLSRWPTGIFRRAFIRAYADAIGLAPDEVVARVERAFTDGDAAAVVTVAPFAHGSRGPDPLRLTLATSPRSSLRRVLLRGAAVALDGAVVAGAATGLAWALQQPLPLAVLGAGTLYFATGTLLCECTPAMWWLRRTHRARPAATTRPEAGDVLATPPVDEGTGRRTDAVPGPRPVPRDRRHGRAERRRATRGSPRPS